MSGEVQPIVMPKWGLAMQEGMLAAWHVEEGQVLAKGQEIMDIETSKIANVFESPVSGKLRRKVVEAGETLPVGALLGVVADESVPEAAVDAFVAEFQAKFAEQMAASAAASGGPEPAYVEVEGRRLRYLELGEAEGVPVVFIHGYGGDLNNWLFNQPALAEKHKTYAVDLPGHGGSSKEVGTGTVQAMSEALLGLLAALGVHRAHLVGHSMGAAVALNLVLHHPEHVASATLLCPAGLGPDISMEYINGFIEANRRKKLEPVLQMLVANPDLVTGDMIEDVLKYKRLDGVDQALKKLRDALFPGGQQALVLKGQIGSARHPVQVIWGAEDRVVPAQHAKGLPGNVKVTILEGAGHLAHMEKATEVNQLVEQLVAGV
jgi:pyruvate dehydrogenase E2 component (dihydrolipoamide acetyltransferase)